MGGFAALSCSDLVDAVLAFGPQIDLTNAPFRPGFDDEALKEANYELRRAVAARRGSVECHFSMDAHLFQATCLHASPHPPRGPRAAGPRAHHVRCIVHPFKGRAARVLERGKLLLPILAEALDRLQHEATETAVDDMNAGLVVDEDEWPSWRWPYGTEGTSGVGSAGSAPEEPKILVGSWRDWTWSRGEWFPPELRVLRTTPEEVKCLAQQVPRPGDWLCPACGTWCMAGQPRCGGCCASFLAQSEHGVVTVPGGDSPAFGKWDWECASCARLEYWRSRACGQCGRERDCTPESKDGHSPS